MGEPWVPPRTSTLAAAGCLLVAGCEKQYHAEYHPETQVHYEQNVAYATTVIQPTPPEPSCPDGSRREGERCVRTDVVHEVAALVECPAGTRRVGVRCEAEIDTTCPRAMHFKSGVGCLPDLLPASARGTPMVSVPAGMFSMGLADGWHKYSALDETPERPRHRVRLPAFAIDRSPVTIGAYFKCVHVGACTPPGKDDSFCPHVGRRLGPGSVLPPFHKETAPVTCVDFAQATAYCAWVGKRLPSEEEWEYAALGTDDRAYPWGDETPNMFWDKPPEGRTCGQTVVDPGFLCPVGLFPRGASPFGVLDMLDSHHEWTASRYCPYSATGTAPCNDERRVLRGVTRGQPVWPHILTWRSRDAPTTQGVDYGFRCAVDE
jgi:formylglycine-generating enzyme required for sulfatase activity